MFIYVMDEVSRDMLVSRGYELIKDNGEVWVFINKKEFEFDNHDIPCVISDMLTF